MSVQGKAASNRQGSMNPFDMAAGNLGQASGIMSTVANMNARSPALIRQGRAQYMNPYTEDVIGATTADINRNLGMQMEDIASGAARSGAFGGSRHGLVESEAMRAATEQIADTSANLRRTGFNDATSFAMQGLNDAYSRAMGSAGGLAGLGQQAFDTGRTITADQYGQGQQAQALQQRLIDEARRMFEGYVQSPQDILNLRLAAVGANPLSSAKTTTQTSQPGLLDYLSMAAGVGGNMFSFNPITLG